MGRKRVLVHLHVQPLDGHVRHRRTLAVLLQVDAQPAALKFGRWVPAVVDLVDTGKLGKVIADVECLMVWTGVLVVDEGDARMPLVVDHVPEQQIVVTEDHRTVGSQQSAIQLLKLVPQLCHAREHLPHAGRERERVREEKRVRIAGPGVRTYVLFYTVRPCAGR